MIQKKLLLIALVCLCVIYTLRVRWERLDNEAFNRNFDPEMYGGLLLSGNWGRGLLVIGLLLFLPDIVFGIRRVPIVLLAVLAFATISALWSVSPFRTMGELADIFIVIAYASVAIELLGSRMTFTAIWWTCFSVLIVGVAVAVWGSPYALMGGHHEGMWRGLFNHKNTFGAFLSGFLVLSILGRSALAVSYVPRVSGIVLGLSSLWMTGSATAIVATAAALIVLGVATVFLRGNLTERIVAAFSGLLAFGVLFVIGLPMLEGFIARGELTLSGRELLWQAAFPYTLQNLVGTGYGTSGGASLIDAMRQGSGWLRASSTHSSYLQMALELGWPPTLVFLCWQLSRVALVVTRGVSQPVTLVAALAVTQMALGLAEGWIGGVYGAFPFMLLILAQLAMSSPRSTAAAQSGGLF